MTPHATARRVLVGLTKVSQAEVSDECPLFSPMEVEAPSQGLFHEPICPCHGSTFQWSQGLSESVLRFYLRLNLHVIVLPPREAERAMGCRWFHLPLAPAISVSQWQVGGKAQLTVGPWGSPDCLGYRVFVAVEEHASMRWAN